MDKAPGSEAEGSGFESPQLQIISPERFSGNLFSQLANWKSSLLLFAGREKANGSLNHFAFSRAGKSKMSLSCLLFPGPGKSKLEV